MNNRMRDSNIYVEGSYRHANEYQTSYDSSAVLLSFSSGQELSAETSAPAVRAVLFFSPTCFTPA
jgi:hypothetical protein